MGFGERVDLPPLRGQRPVWTAIRICPVTAAKSMLWSSQRVIGSAGRHAARSAPNAEYLRLSAGGRPRRLRDRSDPSGRGAAAPHAWVPPPPVARPAAPP